MNGNRNGNGNGDEEEQSQPLLVVQDDPYSILKVDRDASDIMIQSSYKTLSRTFHPDKHPPIGPSRDAAQQVFVKFKNAHDLLLDPVLRQVYDDCGHDATAVVRRTLHSTDPKALYPTLLRFHQLGQKEKARNYFAEAQLEAHVNKEDHSVRIRTAMDFPCSVQSSAWLGAKGGGGPLPPVDIFEQSGASISVNTSVASDSKFDMSVGINSSVQKGAANASGTVNVGWKPQKGTQISSSVNLVHSMALTLTSTRAMANHTVVMTSLRYVPPSRTLALSVVSHRDLWDKMFRASWALGVGSDLSPQYGLVSLTTLSDAFPTCTVKLNVGVSQYPIKVSAAQDLGHGRNGSVSFAVGPKGVECKAILTRSLTSYFNLGMGVQHRTLTGLTWLLQAERGNFTFRVPIFICSTLNPNYNVSLFGISLMSCVINGGVFSYVMDWCIRCNNSDALHARDPTSASTTTITTMAVKKHEAEQQVARMKPTATRNMQREEQKSSGLCIYEAQYYAVVGQQQGVPTSSLLVSVNVTTQLQFFVHNSMLRLPAESKSQLLGFYELVPHVPPTQRRPISSWWRIWQSSGVIQGDGKQQPGVPHLRIRYTFGDKAYEITIADTDALVLPNPKAIVLGPKDRVR